jgi:1,4-dihydroxy-2-naphthoate octaprenyltransferase
MSSNCAQGLAQFPKDLARVIMRSWILAARPKTLLASICPVAIGCALAYRDGVFHAMSAVAAWIGAVSIQIGTNFCNDYCDFLQGADTAERKGPTRAVQAGLISPPAMLWATILMFGIAAATCIYLIWRAGWWLLLIGTLSILFGVLYTAGKKSLAYLGLGDIFVLVFFGPIAVAGTYFVQAGGLSILPLVVGWVPGLISVGLLVVNNLRDIDEDRKANKKTLAVRFGATFARCEYAACMVSAAFILILVCISNLLPPTVLVSLLAILPGLVIAGRIWRVNGTDLNPLLGQTAMVLLLFSVVFCGGCLIAW